VNTGNSERLSINKGNEFLKLKMRLIVAFKIG